MRWNEPGLKIELGLCIEGRPPVAARASRALGGAIAAADARFFPVAERAASALGSAVTAAGTRFLLRVLKSNT